MYSCTLHNLAPRLSLLRIDIVGRLIRLINGVCHYFLGDKMNVEFIGQLIDSMEEGVSRLEQAISKKDNETANKLRVFIFDVHRKISEALRS